MNLFKHYPKKPTSPMMLNAFTILCKAHDAASSFLDIFNKTRTSRKAKGTPTDEEQDLLRAMLVFTSSGLDSMMKQLVRDTLPVVVSKHEGALKMLKQYIEKRIRKNEDIDHKFLANIISETNPQDSLIRELVYELTSNSIQSVEQLLKVSSFFDVPSANITNDIPHLKSIFKVRNEIAHEMDIDFQQSNRNRRPRSKATMIKYTNELFRVSESILKEVSKKVG